MPQQVVGEAMLSSAFLDDGQVRMGDEADRGGPAMAIIKSQQLSSSPSGQRGEAQPETLTFEDLKASIGKGPDLGSDDIAATYDSDEEFLAALETGDNGTSPE